MKRPLSTLVVSAAILATAGCVGYQKSSNPLAPTVAGPIPGVAISTPSTVNPTGGARIAVDQQPVTLTIGNASTSGVRPLSYRLEIATDVAFSSVIFTRDGIAPGDGGQTIFRMPDALATGHTYYWHARAQDGANTGPYSPPAMFVVFTPIVIQAPTLVAPIGNVVAESTHPHFILTDAARSGPVGAVGYIIDIADTDAFSNILATWVISETSGQTGLDSPQDFPANKQLFWRAKAFDPTTQGPYSATATFRTPATSSAPPTGGGGGGGGGGGAANDMLNLGSAIVDGGPSDVASWPAVISISRIDMSPGNGFAFTAPFPGYWNYQAFGGGPCPADGCLQYTVWPVVMINGQWHTAGIVQMWQGRPSTGAFGQPTWHDDFPSNWAYPFAGMAGYHPNPGDQMGFFVTAGNARYISTVTSARERSNVVVITLPAGDTGSFGF